MPLPVTYSTGAGSPMLVGMIGGQEVIVLAILSTVAAGYLALCVFAARLAREKGYSFAGFPVLSILCPVIGLLAALLVQPVRA